MANEFAVTSMADLWVNAAINVDDDPLEGSSYDDGRQELLASTGGRESFPEFAAIDSEAVLQPLVHQSRGYPSRTAMTFSRDNGPLGRPWEASLPGIYHNTGLRSPVPPTDTSVDMGDSPSLHALSSIPEGCDDAQIGSSVDLSRKNLWRFLPLAIIFQYGLLALHSTTHDQIFYSYLVSLSRLCLPSNGMLIGRCRPRSTGGLGLRASHFSQLST